MLVKFEKNINTMGLIPFLVVYSNKKQWVSSAKSRIPFSIVFFVWVVVCFTTVNHIQEGELLLIMSIGKIKIFCVVLSLTYQVY